MGKAEGSRHPEKGKPTLTLARSEEHTSELQSRSDLVCRLLLEKKKKKKTHNSISEKQKAEIQLESTVVYSNNVIVKHVCTVDGIDVYIMGCDMSPVACAIVDNG